MNPMIKAAYEIALGHIEGGNGFRFIVTLTNGEKIDCVPFEEDQITPPKDNVLRVDFGELRLAIPANSIFMIAVYGC